MKESEKIDIDGLLAKAKKDKAINSEVKATYYRIAREKQEQTFLFELIRLYEQTKEADLISLILKRIKPIIGMKQ